MVDGRHTIVTTPSPTGAALCRKILSCSNGSYTTQMPLLAKYCIAVCPTVRACELLLLATYDGLRFVDYYTLVFVSRGQFRTLLHSSQYGDYVNHSHVRRLYLGHLPVRHDGRPVR